MLPPTLTEIGRRTFEGCKSLSEITLPPNVTDIGQHAFFGCTSLSEITLPPNLSEIGGSAFSGCTSLSEITLPPTPTEIGQYAFNGCTSLSEITLPPSLTEIGEYALIIRVHVLDRDHAATQPHRDWTVRLQRVHVLDGDHAPGRTGQHRRSGLRQLPWDAATTPCTVVVIERSMAAFASEDEAEHGGKSSARNVFV